MLKRTLSGLVAVAIVLTVVSFFAAPWVAFRALRAAAAAGDVQGIAAVVDYNAVRTSLRPQLGDDAASTPPPKVWQDPMGALARAIRPPGNAADIEAYLTPQTIAELSNARAVGGARPKGTPFRVGDLLPGLRSSEVRFWDPNRSRIAVVSPRDPAYETIFTFERRGPFTWKLVHIGLPAPMKA